MSLITELVALATQLDTSIKDRKTRELLLPLKEKILDVQHDQLRIEQRHQQEQADIKARHAETEKQLTEEASALKSRNAELESQLLALKNKQGQPKPADTCPFCRHPSGEVQDIKDHDLHVDAKVGFYQCSHCGKTYEHLMDLNS